MLSPVTKHHILKVYYGHSVMRYQFGFPYSLKHFCIYFREIFTVLDIMKMDMANFTIQQIRPFIQQQSVEYERKKFTEFLKQQEGTIYNLQSKLNNIPFLDT